MKTSKWVVTLDGIYGTKYSFNTLEAATEFIKKAMFGTIITTKYANQAEWKDPYTTLNPMQPTLMFQELDVPDSDQDEDNLPF